MDVQREMARERKRIEGLKTAHIEYMDGRRGTGEVIATFDCEANGCKYVLFRDGTKTDDGRFVTYGARYDIASAMLRKTDFETDDVFDMDEVRMINDLIMNQLAKGVFKKTPVLALRCGLVRAVTFT